MQVSVEDANGNVVTTNISSVTIALGANPGSGTLGGTLTAAAVNGVATFSNLSINKAGTGYTLTAADGSLTGATSAAFNITPAAASKLVFSTQPSNTAAGAGIAPPVQVSVEDANDNVVTTNNSSVTIGLGANPGSGTLGGTTTVAAVNGVATFSNLSINKAGTGYTFQYRQVASSLQGEVEQFERGRIDPLCVLEDHQHRLLARQTFERPDQCLQRAFFFALRAQVGNRMPLWGWQ